MSDIQLSGELFNEIQQAVARQHPDADPGTIMQYLAAVIGYMLGSQQGMSGSDKTEYMGQLCEFAKQVYDDVQGQMEQQQAPRQDAFGVWEP